MELNQDKKLIDMLRELVDEKESAVKYIGLLENVLSRNNIYFLIFDNEGLIQYHNIPDRNNLRTLEDCEYIVYKENIEQIKRLMKLAEAPASDSFEVTLKNNILEFTLFNHEDFDGLFFLQITMPGQARPQGQYSEEKELDKTVNGLEDIQQALELLDEIRNIDSTEKRENLSREIRERYLGGLEQLQSTISDPIVLLCLDIIKKNLEEFLAPAGNLPSLYKVLTPSEIKVAEFIRMGKTSKDIADALDIAQKTVENHRNKVRDKLGLRNKSVNLRSYLMQLDD